MLILESMGGPDIESRFGKGWVAVEHAIQAFTIHVAFAEFLVEPILLPLKLFVMNDPAFLLYPTFFFSGLIC